jgi:Fe2+ or Zn2+ uptake regulation protein
MKGLHAGSGAMTTVADSQRQECIRRLRHAGLRVTHPRLLVLQFFTETGGHHSVEEVGTALAARGLRLGRASLYNVVHSLAAHGLLTVADLGPGRTLYELAERWHHHFVCRLCGRILDVPCLAGTQPCLRPRDFPGEVDEAQVILRGRCAECAARRDASPSGAGRPGAPGRRERNDDGGRTARTVRGSR